jgi:hypothetical protein
MTVTTEPARSLSTPLTASLFDPVNLEGSVGDRVRHVAGRRPDHPALIHGGETYTYRALDQLSDRVAAGLAATLS